MLTPITSIYYGGKHRKLEMYLYLIYLYDTYCSYTYILMVMNDIFQYKTDNEWHFPAYKFKIYFLWRNIFDAICIKKKLQIADPDVNGLPPSSLTQQIVWYLLVNLSIYAKHNQTVGISSLGAAPEGNIEAHITLALTAHVQQLPGRDANVLSCFPFQTVS